MHSVAVECPSTPDVDGLIDDAAAALKTLQRPDGHWLFEFEADATIPAEYILLQHYFGEADECEERRIANYLHKTQADHGGWPLFPDGNLDLSATVKAYYALKLTGEDPNAPHMARARQAILARGGAEKSNVFTRISLALFGQMPWRAVPVMPVEIMLLPRWFPFHLSKVSYWSRTVIVPMLILMALKPRARNPRNVDIRELFLTPPEQVLRYITNPTGKRLGDLFVALDKVLRFAEPWLPKGTRGRAIDEAVRFIKLRLNGEDGLGGILPAMTNAVMALDALGYREDDPDLETAKRAVKKLLLLKQEDGYCQPCLSPVWDTCLACHALLEAGRPADAEAIEAACSWLIGREITDAKGDWEVRRPNLAPGGWAFQYWNNCYPDVDDTAVVVMALHRAGNPRYRQAIDRAAAWVIGMQSKNGGWGAFDADNTHFYLNNIPFADHGALLDPPTVDVTARCIGMLAQLGYGRSHPVVHRGLEFLRAEQGEDGSWYGRWGVNYVYGTWSALCAFNATGEDMQAPHIRRAVRWLLSRQREDGGWGEDCATYWTEHRGLVKASTPSQTAWALLGLMAAGEVGSDAVRRGVGYLEEAPRHGASWDERHYTGIGFPRVFYLKYHGYSAYFPLWALARYRNLMRGNDRRVHHGL